LLENFRDNMIFFKSFSKVFSNLSMFSLRWTEQDFIRLKVWLKAVVNSFSSYLLIFDDDRNVNQPLTLTLFSKPVSKGVFYTLCTLYIVYAFIFTFSMLLGVFYLIQGPLIGNLTIVSNTSAKIHQYRWSSVDWCISWFLDLVQVSFY
jgi:hypothetical protein